MKLCHIVPSLEERHGGPSRSVRALAAALADMGDEVDLLATQPDRDAEPIQAGRMRVLQFRRGLPAVICPSRALRDHLHRESYDCIHHHSLWLRTLHYAHRAGVATGVPLVISPRGTMSDWAWRHHRARKWLAARLVHPGAPVGAAGWHATSDQEREDIGRRGFRQPICVAPNGVDPPSPEEMIQAHETWSRLCPAAATRPVALFFSRFHRKKRLLELIDLWLAAAPAEWLLLVAGVPQEYTVRGLTDRLRRRGAADRVMVFDGRDRPPPYGMASLFLLPSHNENFGLVIAEAMAWGVPVLVTNTTPWAEVAGRQAGWCVPWAGYAEALRAALGEGSDRLEQRGARAREWVVGNFAWERAARPLHAFYRQLTRTSP